MQRGSVLGLGFNPGMDSIGARIRTEREAQDIGRGDLAKAAGIAFSGEMGACQRFMP